MRLLYYKWRMNTAEKKYGFLHPKTMKWFAKTINVMKLKE